MGGRCSVPGGMVAMVMPVAVVMLVSHGVGCYSPVGEHRGTAEDRT